jgi:hypothetical protein
MTLDRPEVVAPVYVLLVMAMPGQRGRNRQPHRPGTHHQHLRPGSSLITISFLEHQHVLVNKLVGTGVVELLI